MADAGHRVIRLLVHDESILRFSAQIAAIENAEAPSLTAIGQTLVGSCEAGWFIYLAVLPFRDLSIARAAHEANWYQRAVAALMSHYRQQTPSGVLRLYRDPVNGSLRNLAE